ncbi:proteasome assembly chaperone family protein [uncultured Agrococcus sp.]|uniref:proteasome assembly chaperone family protein n=1 Tax=uncultured Agrococcus sp. TaxID=382258 RepID=UPI0025EB6BE1|nr:PAC2 family protein [uncultured Agrococcus sp.]
MTDGPIRGRILLVAFEGWTDAGDAASEALRLVIQESELETIDSISTEEFLDFNFTRPVIRRLPDGTRAISWPETLLLAPTKPSREAGLADDAGFDMAESVEGNLYALLGVEPSRNWHLFTDTVMELVARYDIEVIVFLGSLLADTPHTRAIPVTVTSEAEHVRERLDIGRSEYEGPTGIISMLEIEAEAMGIPTVQIWASVPHYVQSAPVPKAIVALLDKLGEVIDYAPPLGDLPEQVREWESGVSEFASQDDEMRAYIGMLEERRDTVDSPKASGEALAKEFERFLEQRRDSRDASPGAGFAKDIGESAEEAPDERDDDGEDDAPPPV